MYRVRRVDANQPSIVETFRTLGCAVWITSEVGNGAPDLMVSKNGWTVAVEVKDGQKPPSKRKLTQDEEIWRQGWQGEYAVIETPEQAHQMVAEMTLRASLDSLKACSGQCRSQCGSGG